MLALKPNQAEVEKILKQIYQKMREAFLDCCRTLHNIDAKSLLSVCLHAGTLALPRYPFLRFQLVKALILL